jgi:hypothetical protein
MTQFTLINHPKLQAWIRTGSEGPHHDPYGYEELTVKTQKHKVTIHEGLACFVVVDGKRINATRKTYENFSKVSNRLLSMRTGFTKHQLERIHRKSKRQCPLGGRHETINMNGYPGEHFQVCQKCDKIVDSYFNESAII